MEVIPSPTEFWQKLQALPGCRQSPPDDVTTIIERALPDVGMTYTVARRQAGVGSLGQQRFVAIAEWNGGLVAREVKAMMPSACVWLENRSGSRQSFYKRVIDGAVRSRDPYQFISGRWLVRRLSPEANPIEIANLPKKRDEETLLRAMGREVANVHLGSRQRIPAVLQDLQRRKGNWLRAAAKDMAEATRQDWITFRHSGR